jgi:2-dehydropantoate 2-reductase
MKFLIAGGGAIGSYLAAHLTRTGRDVFVYARGAQLQALKRQDVRIESPEGNFSCRLSAIGNAREAGQVDVVLLAVKAHQLAEISPLLLPVLAAETCIVSLQNGIPWWYFQKHGGELEGTRLEAVDPAGVISSTIETARIIGGIVYLSTSIIEPGVIRHIGGKRLLIGELDDSRSSRCRRIADVFAASGIRCLVTTHLRQEIWVKVLGNIAFNPVSALTGATLAQMVGDGAVSSLLRSIMGEAEAVASKLGIKLPISIDQRMAGAEKVGAHKTSMLQDLEAGKSIELEAIMGEVLALGEKLDVPMPHTRSIYACVKMLEKTIHSHCARCTDRE